MAHGLSSHHDDDAVWHASSEHGSDDGSIDLSSGAWLGPGSPHHAMLESYLEASMDEDYEILRNAAAHSIASMSAGVGMPGRDGTAYTTEAAPQDGDDLAPCDERAGWSPGPAPSSKPRETTLSPQATENGTRRRDPGGPSGAISPRLDPSAECEEQQLQLERQADDLQLMVQAMMAAASEDKRHGDVGGTVGRTRRSAEPDLEAQSHQVRSPTSSPRPLTGRRVPSRSPNASANGLVTASTRTSRMSRTASDRALSGMSPRQSPTRRGTSRGPRPTTVTSPTLSPTSGNVRRGRSEVHKARGSRSGVSRSPPASLRLPSSSYSSTTVRPRAQRTRVSTAQTSVPSPSKSFSFASSSSSSARSPAARKLQRGSKSSRSLGATYSGSTRRVDNQRESAAKLSSSASLATILRQARSGAFVHGDEPRVSGSHPGPRHPSVHSKHSSAGALASSSRAHPGKPHPTTSRSLDPAGRKTLDGASFGPSTALPLPPPMHASPGQPKHTRHGDEPDPGSLSESRHSDSTATATNSNTKSTHPAALRPREMADPAGSRSPTKPNIAVQATPDIVPDPIPAPTSSPAAVQGTAKDTTQGTAEAFVLSPANHGTENPAALPSQDTHPPEKGVASPASSALHSGSLSAKQTVSAQPQGDDELHEFQRQRELLNSDGRLEQLIGSLPSFSTRNASGRHERPVPTRPAQPTHLRSRTPQSLGTLDSITFSEIQAALTEAPSPGRSPSSFFGLAGTPSGSGSRQELTPAVSSDSPVTLGSVHAFDPSERDSRLSLGEHPTSSSSSPQEDRNPTQSAADKMSPATLPVSTDVTASTVGLAAPAASFPRAPSQPASSHQTNSPLGQAGHEVRAAVATAPACMPTSTDGMAPHQEDAASTAPPAALHAVPIGSTLSVLSARSSSHTLSSPSPQTSAVRGPPPPSSSGGREPATNDAGLSSPPSKRNPSPPTPTAKPTPETLSQDIPALAACDRSAGDTILRTDPSPSAPHPKPGTPPAFAGVSATTIHPSAFSDGQDYDSSEGDSPPPSDSLPLSESVSADPDSARDPDLPSPTRVVSPDKLVSTFTAPESQSPSSGDQPSAGRTPFFQETGRAAPTPAFQSSNKHGTLLFGPGLSKSPPGHQPSSTPQRGSSTSSAMPSPRSAGSQDSAGSSLAPSSHASSASTGRSGIPVRQGLGTWRTKSSQLLASTFSGSALKKELAKSSQAPRSREAPAKTRASTPPAGPATQRARTASSPSSTTSSAASAAPSTPTSSATSSVTDSGSGVRQPKNHATVASSKQRSAGRRNVVPPAVMRSPKSAPVDAILRRAMQPNSSQGNGGTFQRTAASEFVAPRHVYRETGGSAQPQKSKSFPSRLALSARSSSTASKSPSKTPTAGAARRKPLVGQQLSPRGSSSPRNPATTPTRKPFLKAGSRCAKGPVSSGRPSPSSSSSSPSISCTSPRGAPRGAPHSAPHRTSNKSLRGAAESTPRSGPSTPSPRRLAPSSVASPSPTSALARNSERRPLPASSSSSTPRTAPLSPRPSSTKSKPSPSARTPQASTARSSRAHVTTAPDSPTARRRGSVHVPDSKLRSPGSSSLRGKSVPPPARSPSGAVAGGLFHAGTSGHAAHDLAASRDGNGRTATRSPKGSSIPRRRHPSMSSPRVRDAGEVGGRNPTSRDPDIPQSAGSPPSRSTGSIRSQPPGSAHSAPLTSSRRSAASSASPGSSASTPSTILVV